MTDACGSVRPSGQSSRRAFELLKAAFQAARQHGGAILHSIVLTLLDFAPKGLNYVEHRVHFAKVVWRVVDVAHEIRQSTTADVDVMPRPMAIRQLTTAEFAQCAMGTVPKEDVAAFVAVPFTLHREILRRCKSADERWYYIRRSAAEFWSVTALQTHLRGGDYRRRGKLPNNFALALPTAALAQKAANVFHDEVFLEGINVGEDEGDVDERLLERSIVGNIRKFMLSLGPDFCFMGEQFRMVVKLRQIWFRSGKRKFDPEFTQFAAFRLCFRMISQTCTMSRQGSLIRPSNEMRNGFQITSVSS